MIFFSNIAVRNYYGQRTIAKLNCRDRNMLIITPLSVASCD